MGTIIGAGISMILFLFLGLLPVFRFGSYAALFFLHKVSGASGKAAPAARGFVILVAVLSIVSGALLSMVIGALIGAMLF